MKFILLAFSAGAVFYPLYVWFSNRNFDLESMPSIFPSFGIIAFVLLWLHSMSGVFEPWLRKHFNFDKFIHYTSIAILISFLLHPLLLLLNLGFNIQNLFLIYEAKYVWFGIIAFLLLITYDIGKALQKKQQFFVTHWNKILIISTIGFIVAFFHSINIGSDLQSGPLRTLWMFYGVTGILASIYTYGIKRFLK